MSVNRFVITLGALVVAGAIIQADALILKDGRRVSGQLVGVRNGVIEFEEQRGLFGRQVSRYDRNDVRRIELDDNGSGSNFDGSGNNDRPGGGGGGGGSDRPPSGMREREISVAAHVPWTDTGIDVRLGQTLYFAATGQIRWGPDRRDGPGGESKSPYNANRPIPGRPAAALIGRIGRDAGDPFFIGDDRGPVRVREGGRLLLGVNDDFLQDNAGNLRVTIYY